MKSTVAIVESVHMAAIREINGLERCIVKFEDDADEKLWEQARQVVALLEGGMTQRALAAQWINVRTGKPYSKSHVVHTIEVLGHFTDQPRPRFRDAYNDVANAKPRVRESDGAPSFDFTVALSHVHDILLKIYDASSVPQRKRFISDLRAFLETIETRTY